MADFFIGRLPDVLWHGSLEPLQPGAACRPACESAWWNEISWNDYDEDLEGEARTAYANVLFEHLGLRCPGSGDVPEWARHVGDPGQLGREFGILFVTDDPARAEALYGPVQAIDMTSPDILDVAVDPNAATHAAWILVMRAGAPLPVLDSPAARP